ncbi:MAG: alpha/beta hydrolase [Kiritimatiellae bacterium]|nr:alpha/beta hydrolase [Kiritimatiellia bacterium]
MMIKDAFKSAAKIIAIVVVLLILIGTGCINSLMFHPVKGKYNATTRGYVDIGTNGVKVAAIVYGPERGKKAIIRCHGNAEDALSTLDMLELLAEGGYTVASVDYPGYGLSDGSPDEEGCYRNVHRLYDWLIETRGFKPEEIIVDGFSIGTGPATELAATCPCGGLILEAPFLSAPRVVTRVRLLPVDPFPNLKRIGDVKCRVLMIHGTGDRVIPYSQGQALFKLANEPKRFVTVDDGDHNTLVDDMGFDNYYELIKEFVDGAGVEPRQPDMNGGEQ